VPEVGWAAAAPSSADPNYRFYNDTGGQLVVLAGTRVAQESDDDARLGDFKPDASRVGKIIVSVQIWGTAPPDGRFASYSVENRGNGRLAMVRKLTRVDPSRLTTSMEAKNRREGHRIDIVKTEQTTLPDRSAATVDTWEYESIYNHADTQVVPFIRTGETLSRRHPQR